MRILIVLTSHDQLGDTGHKTGFWLEEFAAPYYVFKDAGAQITLASPKGGRPPLDPRSNEPGSQTADTQRFEQDPAARDTLANTVALAEAAAQPFDAVFFAGGHGPLWDLAESKDSIALIERTAAAGTPLGLVCHAPAALRHTKSPSGAPLVQGRRVTGFTNAEEVAARLDKVVPFLVEDMLKERGADFAAGPMWHPHVVRDGTLVTGQNPASSTAVARQLLGLVQGC